MTKLSNHQSGQTTKLLLIGDSGGGKSGSLASLASAGYNLWIVDLDNGIDIIRNVLRDPRYGYAKDAIDRVNFITITDPMRQSGGKLIPTKASVWQRVARLLAGDDPWGEEGKMKALDMTDKDVLVIDSLTFLSKAAMNFVLSMNARLGQKPHQSDWYEGQLLIEGIMEMLYDEAIKCNVVVISHIAYIGEDNGPQVGYPSTLGKALPPKIGRYFNSILQAKTSGVGTSRKHKIVTASSGMVELKNSAPLHVAKEYPLETGLADFFRDIRTLTPSSAPQTLTEKAPPVEGPKGPSV